MRRVCELFPREERENLKKTSRKRWMHSEAVPHPVSSAGMLGPGTPKKEREVQVAQSPSYFSCARRLSLCM